MKNWGKVQEDGEEEVNGKKKKTEYSEIYK